MSSSGDTATVIYFDAQKGIDPGSLKLEAFFQIILSEFGLFRLFRAVSKEDETAPGPTWLLNCSQAACPSQRCFSPGHSSPTSRPVWSLSSWAIVYSLQQVLVILL